MSNSDALDAYDKQILGQSKLGRELEIAREFIKKQAAEIEQLKQQLTEIKLVDPFCEL